MARQSMVPAASALRIDRISSDECVSDPRRQAGVRRRELRHEGGRPAVACRCSRPSRARRYSSLVFGSERYDDDAGHDSGNRPRRLNIVENIENVARRNAAETSQNMIKVGVTAVVLVFR